VADKLFKVSGVMATVSAGIMMAGWGKTRMSVAASSYLHYLLELLAYIANALIFLLVGFSIHIATFESALWVIFIVIMSMLLSRAVVIYTLIPFINRIRFAERIDFRYQTIMWWGGFCGAISLALVLSLTELPNHDLLISVVMGVVLFTMIVQGLSVKKYIQYFKLDKVDIADQIAKIEAEMTADKKTMNQLPVLRGGGLFSMRIFELIKERCEKSIKKYKKQLKKLRSTELDKHEETRLLFLNCYAIEKHLYEDMYKKAYLSPRIYQQLIHDIDIEADMMRYHGRVSQKVPKRWLEKYKESILHLFTHLPLLKMLVNRIRINQTIFFYEEQWGLHQGCVAVINYLDSLKNDEVFSRETMDSVREQFQLWRKVTRQYLDDIAEEFPEFVSDMQKRLAERILLHAKQEVIQKNADQGLLPKGIADQLIYQYTLEIRRLKKEHPEKLKLDPHELIKRIPFFAVTSKEQSATIITMFDEIHVLPEEIIIREGEVGKEMFLILRGLVRVLKEEQGEQIEVATLMPGDIFGEIALLQDVKRVATCKAVTPCVLYSLSRSHFEDLIQQFPDIKREMEKEAKKHQ
jgi:CPA1 family monovalent cation:H+ antiporter